MLLALGRFLGLQALAHLSARLPLVWGWALGFGLMLVANASPLLTLRFGSWGVTDVVLFYAIENALVVLTTTVRLLTYRQGSQRGDFFFPKPPAWLTGSPFGGLFFGAFTGLFTVVATIFAAMMATQNTLQGSAVSWVVNLVLMAVGYLGTMAVMWFGQDQRSSIRGMGDVVAMAAAPAPRIFGLHMMVILLAFRPAPVGIPVIVSIVVAAKIIWDFGLMVVEVLVLRAVPARRP